MSDLYEKITATIIEQLEAGTKPWQKPWEGSGSATPLAMPTNASTGNTYRGINIPLLWMAAENGEYACHEWSTYRQWQEQKESVGKGEKGTLIIYYDTFEKEQDDGDLKKMPFIKCSYVFNRCQLASYTPGSIVPPTPKPLIERIAAVDEFIANTKAIIEHKGNRACYVPAKDKIYMPKAEAFIATEGSTATENYYSTLLHETAHWSGHPTRCNRNLKGRFGSQHYAMEELVAELSAAFLCASLDITNAPRPDHANYLASWLKALKDDKKAIFTAASQAHKATDYLSALME